MDMPSTPDMATKVLGGDTPDKAAISSKGRLFEVCIGTEVHPVYDHQLHPFSPRCSRSFATSKTNRCTLLFQ